MVDKKILVLGDGLLGSELVKQTGWDYVSRKKNKKNLFDLLPMILFNDAEIVVNCIANTDTYSNDKKSMMDVNYNFVVQYTYLSILSHLLHYMPFLSICLVNV